MCHIQKAIVFILCVNVAISQECLNNPCDSDFSKPCKNNGTCVFDHENCQTSCHCKDGFTGEECGQTTEDGEMNINSNKCLINICEVMDDYCFNGSCVYDYNTCLQSCLCTEGYSGRRCSEIVTEAETTFVNAPGIANTTAETKSTFQALATVTNSVINDRYNVCTGEDALRPLSERGCGQSKPCIYGVCYKTLVEYASWTGYQFNCTCDTGARGTHCEHICCLDCGEHGFCDNTESTGYTPECSCDAQYDGLFCDVFIPPPTSIELRDHDWYLWIVGVCIGMFVLLLVTLVVVPYMLWKHRVILVMKIVHYFQAYEDNDEKQWDAFVSYKADEVDEHFVVHELYPKLEKEFGFKLCLHFRDFVPGETISNNIINAVEGSRRTILILTPRYINSEFTKFEYEKAQEELLKRKHRIIPIVLEDISAETPNMDQTLKSIIKSVTYLEWPNQGSDNSKKLEKFWKRLELSLPKKKVSDNSPISLSSHSTVSQTSSSMTLSTVVDGNISPGFSSKTFDKLECDSIYDEIGTFDVDNYVIEPMSEKEELELQNEANTSRGITRVTQQIGRDKCEFVKQNSYVDLNDCESQKDKNLILSMGDFNVRITDGDYLKDKNEIIELEDQRIQKYMDYFV